MGSKRRHRTPDRGSAAFGGIELSRTEERTSEGQGIYDAITGIPPAPSCGDLEKEIEARAQVVIVKGREANEEFDSARATAGDWPKYMPTENSKGRRE